MTPSPLDLDLFSPRDGAIAEIPLTVAVGQVRPDAIVTVNGETADVDEEGIFRAAVPLEEGANLVEVVASELLGESTDASVVVFFDPPAGDLPLSLFHPADGFETSRTSIHVLGGTAQDAVVTINGLSVSVDETGLFDGETDLREGPNLIEVVVSNQLGGNQRSVSVIVFRVP